MLGIVTIVVVLWQATVFGADAGHPDPIAGVVLWLAIILVSAQLGGDLAVRIGQPAVLGELLIGVALGNLSLLGFSWLEPAKTDPAIDMLARLGVLLLLFEVGLESTVGQMLRVGLSATAVAILGVAAPLALGWAVGVWFLPDSSLYVHLFLGATLCATSVGITARVLKDLGRSDSSEARVILGAAVVDDVLGLVVLAVVTGLVASAGTGGSFTLIDAAAPLVKATIFLAGALFLGVLLSPRLFSLASRLRARGVLLALGLSFCFTLSWLASLIGLASIVGAFAAGLLLEHSHYRDFVDRGERGLEELVHPITAFLAPVFFVLMGMHTDLSTLADPRVLGLGAALILAAIVGKQACSLGVIGAGVDRLTVGIGMIPRGEVGLIFANIGAGLAVNGQPIISRPIFAALVLMVIATTLVTPPALKWSFARRPRG